MDDKLAPWIVIEEVKAEPCSDGVKAYAAMVVSAVALVSELGVEDGD